MTYHSHILTLLAVARSGLAHLATASILTVVPTAVLASVQVRAPDIAENGNVIPVEITFNPSLSSGESAVILVNGNEAARIVMQQGSMRLFSTRFKSRTGASEFRAKRFSGNREVESGAYNVRVTIGADQIDSGGPLSNDTGIKVRQSGNQFKMLGSGGGFNNTLTLDNGGGFKAMIVGSGYFSKNPYIGVGGSFNEDLRYYFGYDKTTGSVAKSSAPSEQAVSNASMNGGDYTTAMTMMEDGYKAGDRAKMERAIRMLENLANHGSGEAAFNLAALYHLSNSPFHDEEKTCPWTIKAASLNYVNAYWGAASCELKANRGGDKQTTYDRYSMPWIKKVAAEDPRPEDRENARQLIDQWEQAKRDAASSPSGTVTLGSLFSALGINSYTRTNSSQKDIKNTSSDKTYVCKIYCKSASGPITRYEISAKNRSAAADYVGDHANEICNNAGLSYASTNNFSELQCSEK